MAIRKVVVTHDFTDETYGVFYRKEPGLIFAHMGNMAQNQMDQQLFGHLRDLGVDVDMRAHKEGADIPSTIADLEARLRDADLVFHETPRVAFEMDDSEWKEAYQKAIESLVHTKFLGKSHFASHDVKYSEKQEAAKIARDAGIPMPKSWTVDEYLASDRQLPVIMKANWSTCGQGIHFIDKHDQMDTFWDVEKYKEIGRNSLLQEKIMKFRNF